MASKLILINGLPGSGKSTLAAQLARELNATAISKDVIKEAVATALDLPAELSGTIGAASMEMAWSIAASVPETVIVESWWFRDRDLEHARSGITRVAAGVTVELWCQVPAHVARTRLLSRQRHSIHRDAERLDADWATWASRGRPLGIGPTITVDTTEPVDVSRLVRYL